MGKMRLNIDHVNTISGDVSSGNITISSYSSSSPDSIATFYFVIPKDSMLPKKYWKSLKIKGFTGFSARKITVKGGIASYASSDTADVKEYVYNFFGTYNDPVETSISAKNIEIAEKYNDLNVEKLIASVKHGSALIQYSIVPIATYINQQSPAYWLYNEYTIQGIENIYLEIEYDDFGYDVVPVFPVNVSIKPTQDNNFAFQLNNTGHSRSSFSVSNIKLTVHQNDEDYEYTLSDGQTYQTIEAGTLVVGQATYDIVANNTYDEPNTSGTIHFTCVGPSEAPTITSVTQNSFPTISWTSSNQRAWELIVRNANGIVFDSGMTAGSAKSCKLNKMLQNGAYYAELRVLNTFGYYTDWDTYGFTLTPTAPAAPTDILISVTNDYGVAVDCKAPTNAGTLYVVRRKNSADDPVIIGKYESGFVDYTIPLNTTYEYTVRNYSTGCADGDWMDVTVNAPGIIIRNGEDIKQFVHLWKVESGEFNLMRSDVRSNTLMQCVGRTYPVKESGEWITASRNVDVFVPADSYDALVDMAVNSKFVYLQNKGEFLPCNLELDDDGEFISSGRLTKVILTRIDEV